MARTLKKRCIAIVHESVILEGAFTENERVMYDPKRPLSTLMKLAATVGTWQRESGRQMKVMVLPPEVAEVLASNVDDAVCEYRYYDARGKASAWQKVDVVPEQGGPIVYIDGAQEDCLMEVRFKLGSRSWTSRATPPYARVQLRETPQ